MARPRTPRRCPRPTTTLPTGSPRRPIAIAITGGIGAGKSETLRAFARHGAPTLSSDEVVHRLLREDEGVRRALIDRFGERILAADGSIDRSRVGEIVFADRAELAWLEALLHPLAAAAHLRWRAGLAEGPDPPDVCVAEVPLLYETGAESRFDAVVVVSAPRDVRVGRIVRPDLDLRERRLLPDEEKLRRADYAYVNDGSLEQLDAFVVCVLEAVRRR